MRRILVLLFLALGLAASAQNSVVIGKLSGCSNTPVYIYEVVNGSLSAPDTIRPNAKGDFKVTFPVLDPTLYVVRFGNLKCNDIHLMLLPGERVNMEMEFVKDYDFMSLKSVKGSKNMALYQEFNKILGSDLDRKKAINQEFQLATTTDQRKMELSNQWQSLETAQRINMKKLIEKNTSSLMSAFLVTFFEEDIVAYLPLYEAVYDGLKKDYANNSFVKHIGAKINSMILPGKVAPEIAMKDPEGNTRKLSDLRGKVVMIDFWASWCRPCRQENPNVVRVYKKYKDAGFDIYSVSLDKDKNSWVRAIQNDGLEWPNHVSDLNGWTSSGGAAYNVTSVPHTVLLDREGRVIAKDLRGAALELKLKEIFGF